MTTRTSFDVITDELGDLSGAQILDIGCGKGALAARFQQLGATWTGLDPFAPDDPGITRAGAEAMPFDDAQFDHAVCVNALHHVPVPAMPAALAEAARVLRPHGRLIVIEPRAEGALSHVIAVVDDETAIRHAAQDAMDAVQALRLIKAYDYPRTERYADFDAFCATLTAVDPSRAEAITAHRDALHQRFAQTARALEGGYALDQPMSARIFTPR
ncbi:class I SAM-dependent methyltransferase [Tropicibacter naphthalenivorans]|uniref:3-demethylubiquinone-9 3-methyltransferase n=1 Tax=Tropicibacter naphthalenivorans TaxID=441103 RepID=A0A0P1GDY7_9RHOB|nr:class I SAM-dependent methyltransferase [Tropicibacter naphthalenivorans]CUH79491.1 3-demethylubiquinone-9 3-methyltransferase [Tropicibacter naphthalenivorans]SMC73098.1 pimeloyl-CoA biosynthesis protein BioC [Tropicibacter naphthalenivorans]